MKPGDPLANLRRVRVPLWARAIGWLNAWLAARAARRAAQRKVHHVATVYAWTYWTDLKQYSRSWYICREDGRGRRSFEYGSSHHLLRRDHKQHVAYAAVITRWMTGDFSNERLREYERKTVNQPDERATP